MTAPELTPEALGELRATFVERVSERHFPWHYTAFGVLCCCGRPVRSDDDCEVMLRARRWAALGGDA